MYTEADFHKANADFNRHILATLLIALLGAGGLITGIIVQNRWIAVASCILFSCLTYSYISLKVNPFFRYRKFMNDMRAGRSRELTGWFVSCESEPRRADGILIHDVIVRVGDAEEDERLFFWDDDKQPPTVWEGARVHIRSFGNFITELAVLD